MPLTSQEVALANEIGFDLELCLFVKERAGRRLERATGISGDYEPKLIDGISFQVRDGDEAERVIDALQPVLLPKGYRAFWSVRRAPNGLREGDEVVVLKTTDHFAIVRVRQTAGGNYNISNNKLVSTLRSWEKRCRFDVVGASDDWVALQFRSLPENLCAFAGEVYRFCPDTVEQGVGLINESEDPQAFAAARRLCPKLSRKTLKVLDKDTKAAEQRGGNVGRVFRSLMKAVSEMPQALRLPSTEMGIKLLAYEIKRTKFLFLWWD
jgi:hypothetical protein